MKKGLVQIPLLLDKTSKVPLQRQIVVQIRLLIEKGMLSPGAPLPSIGGLSKEHGIARNTVILAFQRLAEEGWITMRHGAVSTVSTSLPETRPKPSAVVMFGTYAAGAGLPKARRTFDAPRAIDRPHYPVDFRLGETAPELFPRDSWQHWASILIRHSADHLSSYQNPFGLPELRSAIAEHVAVTRGIETTENEIVIVQGIQEALSLLSWIFIDGDSRVLLESPGYRGAYSVFRAYGAKLFFLPVGYDGIDPQDIPDGDYSLLHTTPSHQFPLGVTLSNERRKTLLTWARRNGCYVIENDYDADFRYCDAPLSAMAAHNRNQVIYLGTFSKHFGPGLRLGYMICPPSLSLEVVKAKALLNNGCPWLEQAVIARMMQNGEFGAHLRRSRRIYSERRDGLVKTLLRFGGRILGDGGGVHLSWELPDNAPDARYVEQRLCAQGIKVYRAEEIAACSDSHAHMARMLFLGFATASPENLDLLGIALEKILSGI